MRLVTDQEQTDILLSEREKLFSKCRYALQGYSFKFKREELSCSGKKKSPYLYFTAKLRYSINTIYVDLNFYVSKSGCTGGAFTSMANHSYSVNTDYLQENDNLLQLLELTLETWFSSNTVFKLDDLQQEDKHSRVESNEYRFSLYYTFKDEVLSRVLT